MKFAISVRTGKEIYADYKVSRADRYKCPTCSSRVILRAGDFRDPYFAHSSGHKNQAKLNCEEYRTGLGHYVTPQILKKSISIADRKIEAGKHDYFTTLCVEDLQNDFNLYLSIPNIPFDRDNPISLSDLQKFKIRLTAGSTLIGQLPLIELFTGGVKARFDVKPTERDYELKAINNSGVGVEFDSLESPIEGLSPKGNLFAKIDSEWIRVFPRSEIEWGEEFYYVSQENTSVPLKCSPEVISVKKGYTRNWKLWRISLPVEPDEIVEIWLNRIDYYVVEARWKLQLLSVPRDYDAIENVFYFNTDEPILLKATSPFSKSKTILTCESSEARVEKFLITSNENDCFISVKGNFDKIYFDDYPETVINAVFVNEDDLNSLIGKITQLPSIRLRLKDEFFESFPKIEDEKMNSVPTDRDFELRDIEITLKPEGLKDFVEGKINVHYFGASMIFKNRLTFKETKSEILDIIQKNDSGILTIDAGSLGVISLTLKNKAIIEKPPSQTLSKISGWLSSLALSSGRIHQYVGMNSAVEVKTAHKGSRHYIVHSRSSLVSAQARAMSKRTKR